MDAGRPYPDGIAWDEAWFQRQRADDAEMAIRRLAEQADAGAAARWKQG